MEVPSVKTTAKCSIAWRASYFYHDYFESVIKSPERCKVFNPCDKPTISPLQWINTLQISTCVKFNNDKKKKKKYRKKARKMLAVLWYSHILGGQRKMYPSKTPSIRVHSHKYLTNIHEWIRNLFHQLPSLSPSATSRSEIVNVCIIHRLDEFHLPLRCCCSFSVHRFVPQFTLLFIINWQFNF